ncbi:hypothetical protein L1987_54279 [Smallanthus sonchifolius]|uniref:Uncharacterized protein n=1 Tax=Smallanthus sonchifolius TaxID=185202 RepID=A0ACB9E730_9ASTR|nr:hypothetical protein L1987_54279 [Smallanthus sonchifolius]
MALIRKLFYKKPPDGLLEISERVYGCPLLTMEAIHHYLRACESWLSFGMQNVLLMHCECGGWPVLAFMLAALLIYSKHYSGEAKTLDMVYKQAPSELLHLFSALNPLPSQLRYLQYVSRRNVATEWPPLDRALSLDCVIMRLIPDVDGNGGCCPIFSIYGQDPYMPGDKTTKLLFTTPKRNCEIVIIDVDCHIQGDIVLECINLHDDWEHQNLIYRAMFNTSFIRSNILVLNRYEIDILWDANYQFPEDFKAEFLFSEMDATASVVPIDSYFFQKSEGLPIEAFTTVQEMFNSVDWPVPKSDAAFNALHQITAPDYGQVETMEKPVNSQTTLNSSTSPISSSTSILPHNLSTHKPVHPYLHVTGDKESPLTKSDQPLQKPTDIEVRMRPTQTGSPTRSTFLPPSLPLKDVDTKAGTSQHVSSPGGPSISSREEQSPAPQTPRTPGGSLASPPPSPPTPPLREKLARGDGPTPPRSSTCPTTPSQEKPDMKSGPSPPWSPPPPTAPTKEKTTPLPSQPVSPPPPTAPTKEKTTPSPSQPVSPPPPTAPTKEKTTPSSQPAPPPPTTAPTKEKTTPPPSQLVSPPPTTAPMKEKTTPAPSQQVSPPHTTAPTKEKTPPPWQPVSPPHTTTPTKEKTPPPSQPVSPPRKTVPTKDKTPPPSQPVSPPHPTAPTKEKTPPPSQPVSPPHTTAPTKEKPETKAGYYTPAPPPPPLPPPPPTISLKETSTMIGGPSPPPLPPAALPSSVPPPPPPLAPSSPSPNPPPPPPQNAGGVPPPPPPSRGGGLPGAPAPPPPLGRGRGLSLALSKNQNAKKLKPLHWLKLTRAVQGSLWAETSKSGEAVKTPEIDFSELENLFSAANPNSDKGAAKSKSASKANKPEKVQLIDHRRAYNCEIMLSKVKIPLHELMVSDLRKSLNSVNSAVEQANYFHVRSSSKFKRVMQTILTLGNALNQGTARGAAVGFRLDSLLKLTDTRARNNRMTLMHYLCKVLAEKLPELLDFSKDLDSLEPASKSGNLGGSVVSTLRNFVRMFNQAHDENCKKIEAEKKKAEKDKESSNEMSKNDSNIDSDNMKKSFIKTV